MWTEGRKILLAVSNWLSDLSQPVCSVPPVISRHERNTSSCLQELQGSVRESPANRVYQTGEVHLESTGTSQPVDPNAELSASFLTCLEETRWKHNKYLKIQTTGRRVSEQIPSVTTVLTTSMIHRHKKGVKTSPVPPDSQLRAVKLS